MQSANPAVTHPCALPVPFTQAVDIPIVTGMGSARNNINALSSNVLVAVGMGPGTASEVALALKVRMGCSGSQRLLAG